MRLKLYKFGLFPNVGRHNNPFLALLKTGPLKTGASMCSDTKNHFYTHYLPNIGTTCFYRTGIVQTVFFPTASIVRPMHVTDKSDRTSVLCLFVSKGQCLRSGILVSINSVLPVQRKC